MSAPLFRTRAVSVGYPGRPRVIDDLDLELPRGGFTSIVGPNGCGKSTLLLALGRLLRPEHGAVFFDGVDLQSYAPRALAHRLAFLPQQPMAPEGICVRDLVMRGRQPHRRFLLPPSRQDVAAVETALAVTGTADLADAPVHDLSGGQRQRVWVAMAFAQDTDTVLLDEPTSFLDIGFQIDVLDACAQLVAAGRSVVAVLHDLGLAARYSDHMIVMREGQVEAAGRPAEVVQATTVEKVFGLPCRVVNDPETSSPLVIPGPPGRRPSSAPLSDSLRCGEERPPGTPQALFTDGEPRERAGYGAGVHAGPVARLGERRESA